MADAARHNRERERIRDLARNSGGYVLGPCKRSSCGHSTEDHRLDDSKNVSPTDPEAEYRCVGHQEGDRWIDTRCDCPDYVQNIVKVFA